MIKKLKFPSGNEQINTSSCGPNAFKQVILYKKGLIVPEHNLINMSCCSKTNGTPIRGMEQIARKFNLNYNIKHNSSVDDIISSVNKENPSILLIQAWGSGHFVVANGYDDKLKKIFYYDPFDGKTKSINYETLDKKWHGVDLFERNHFGMFFKN